MREGRLAKGIEVLFRPSAAERNGLELIAVVHHAGLVRNHVVEYRLVGSLSDSLGVLCHFGGCVKLVAVL